MNRKSIVCAVMIVACAIAFGISCARGELQSWLLLRNSLLLSLGACGIALPLGTLVAIIVMRTDVPGRRTLGILLISLLFLPLYINAAAWDAGFGQLGWYTLSADQMTEPWLDGWRAAIWVHGMASVPWVALLVSAAIRFVPRELEEEALLSGIPVNVLWRVTLPRLRPALIVAALWVLLSTTGEMTVTDLYQVRTYAEVLYTGFALGDDLSDSAQRILPGIVATSSLVLIGTFVAASLARSFRAATRQPLVFSSGKWRWPLFAALLTVTLVAAALPLGNLLYKAGVTVQQLGGERTRIWSITELMRNLGSVPWKYGMEFVWTGILAATTATITVCVAIPLAWLARRGGLRAAPAISIAAIGLAIPGPLVGLSLIWILDRPTPALFIWLYDQTLFAPIAALSIRTLPLAILLCWYVFRSVVDEVLDAAACDGAGSVQRFVYIVLPSRAGALAAVWLAAFAVAAGDLACSILVIPADVTTVPIRVFELLHSGNYDQVAAICLTMLAVFLVSVLGIFVLVRRILHRKSA